MLTVKNYDRLFGHLIFPWIWTFLSSPQRWQCGLYACPVLCGRRVFTTGEHLELSPGEREGGAHARTLQAGLEEAQPSGRNARSPRRRPLPGRGFREQPRPEPGQGAGTAAGGGSRLPRPPWSPALGPCRAPSLLCSPPPVPPVRRGRARGGEGLRGVTGGAGPLVPSAGGARTRRTPSRLLQAEPPHGKHVGEGPGAAVR